jgi:protoporphyrinogen oxidase
MLFAGATGAELAACAQKKNTGWKVSQWTGDDFTIGHRFRIGELPKFSDAPEKTHDVVIIGGGIAGLGSAFYLRDHDFVLLEQYADAGGHERGGSFRGIDFSYGAAFVDTVEGEYGKFYSDLGIKPYKIPEGDNAFFWEKKWLRDTAGGDSSLYREFKKFNDANVAALKALPAEDTPSVVADNADAAKLDAVSFSSLLTGYSPEFVSLLDSICKSATCGGTQRISAFMGLLLVEDVSSSNYVFEGGNSAIAKAAVKKVHDRVHTGCFVWSAEVSDKGAKVQYTDAAGQPHTIACKHLIVATPPMVAWRQLKGIDDKTRAAMMQYKYGSYLVANCLLDKPIFDGAYDNWFASPYTISDVVTADTPYKLGGKLKASDSPNGSVLTVYHPWEPGSEGRTLLLEGDRTKLSKMIHDQMQTFVSDLDDHLIEMVLTRWGHALAVTTPGYYSRLAKFAAANRDSAAPYSLAHSTFHGMPCTEAAIRGARYAADRVLRRTIK